MKCFILQTWASLEGQHKQHLPGILIEALPCDCQGLNLLILGQVDLPTSLWGQGFDPPFLSFWGLFGLHHAHSEIGWPSLSASIPLFWGAATSAAITRSRSTAADHKASLALVMSGFIGMAGHPEMQSTY
jgi:hypothetical protein